MGLRYCVGPDRGLPRPDVVLYLDMDRWTDADTCMQEVLDGMRARFGGKHPEVILAQRMLVQIDLALDRTDDAVERARALVPVVKEVTPVHHAAQLWELATEMFDHDEPGHARTFCLELLEVRRAEGRDDWWDDRAHALLAFARARLEGFAQHEGEFLARTDGALSGRVENDDRKPNPRELRGTVERAIAFYEAWHRDDAEAGEVPRLLGQPRLGDRGLHPHDGEHETTTNDQKVQRE